MLPSPVTRNSRPHVPRTGPGSPNGKVVHVSRKISLGALLGRCRSIITDAGHSHLTLLAMTAAIPHALLLLHSLIDVLPVSSGRKGVSYEIRTSSVQCIEEGRRREPSKTSGAHTSYADDDQLRGVGSITATTPHRQIRTQSTMQIDIYIHASHSAQRQPQAAPELPSPSRTKNRPSKRKRLSTLNAQLRRTEHASVDRNRAGDPEEEHLVNIVLT